MGQAGTLRGVHAPAPDRFALGVGREQQVDVREALLLGRQEAVDGRGIGAVRAGLVSDLVGACLLYTSRCV